MEKQCTRCGHAMYLYLRKLVYMNHTQIDHVPMHRCCYCEHHELVEQVKEDLKQCLQCLQRAGDRQAISFAEHSAFTRMMLRKDQFHPLLDMDEKLDLYLLVKTLGDAIWSRQILDDLLLTHKKKCE